MSLSDEHWMREAIALARMAEMQGEVPVGAVLVKEGTVIGVGHNQAIQLHDCTAHAEIQAIRNAGQQLQNYRLPGSELFVTLEPCAMCASAIVHARIAKVVFGAYDQKTGVVSSVMNFFDAAFLNHRVGWTGGLLEQECRALMQGFFQQRR